MAQRITQWCFFPFFVWNHWCDYLSLTFPFLTRKHCIRNKNNDSLENEPKVLPLLCSQHCLDHNVCLPLKHSAQFHVSDDWCCLYMLVTYKHTPLTCPHPVIYLKWAVVLGRPYCMKPMKHHPPNKNMLFIFLLEENLLCAIYQFQRDKPIWNNFPHRNV